MCQKVLAAFEHSHMLARADVTLARGVPPFSRSEKPDRASAAFLSRLSHASSRIGLRKSSSTGPRRGEGRRAGKPQAAHPSAGWHDLRNMCADGTEGTAKAKRESSLQSPQGR